MENPVVSGPLQYFPPTQLQTTKKRKIGPAFPESEQHLFKFWAKPRREELKKHHPNLKIRDVEQRLIDSWMGLTNEQKIEIEKEFKRNEEAKKKRQNNINAYFIWCRDHRKEVHRQNKGVKAQNITTKLAVLWAELSDEQKIPYYEKERQMKEDYKAKHGDPKHTKKESVRKRKRAPVLRNCNQLKVLSPQVMRSRIQRKRPQKAGVSTTVTVINQNLIPRRQSENSYFGGQYLDNSQAVSRRLSVQSSLGSDFELPEDLVNVDAVRIVTGDYPWNDVCRDLGLRFEELCV